jgi:predicted ATP-grasp superfamily ATP-dependent carboligase
LEQLMGNDATPSAIVTDASERVALHVIRALGRKGVRVQAVEIAGRSPQPLGFLSRYTTQASTIPSWETSAEAWLQGLLSLGQPGDVLMPCCLNTVLRVLAHREALAERFRFLLPPESVLRCANDKGELYQLACRLGIPAPRTYCPHTEEEAREVAASLDYPAIVKLRHDEDLYLPSQARRAKVDSPSELLEAWQRLHALQPNPLVQEFIKGRAYGFECLYDADGSLVATCSHRRLMEYPAPGGPSAVCESVRDARLEELGRRLLEGLGWRGVAMAQFHRSDETGELCLLEVNPRFWGSLPLAEAAGVNFPHMLYRAALQEPVAPVAYRAGVRMRLLPTYLLSVCSSFRARPWALGDWLPKLLYLLDPRVHEGLFCLDDLRPALGYLAQRSRGV